MKYPWLFFFLFFPYLVFGQIQQYTLQGEVKDEGNRPIEGAFIQVQKANKSAISDGKGKFSIALPIGEYTIVVSHVNFETAIQTIELNKNMDVQWMLKSKNIQLNEVVITDADERKNIETVSAGLIKLKTKDIENLPTFLGEVDIVKSISLLPGVSSIGEGSSGFNVRGGRIDQNLVLLDGVQLFNTAHVLGFFSVFNPDATSDFTLYKGAIPAQFGGRVSSVLNVTTRAGNPEKLELNGSVGTISSKIAVNGPITDNITFFTALRFTYSDWILKRVKDLNIQKSNAGFYDFNGRLDYLLNQNNKLTLTFFQSNDEFQFADEFGFEWSNQLVNISWNSNISEQITSTLSANISNYKSTLFDYQLARSAEVNNGISKWQIKENVQFEGFNYTINSGFEIINNALDDETRQPLNNSGIVPLEVTKDTGREWALYIDGQMEMSKKVTLSLGLRATRYQNFNNGNLFVYEDVPVNSSIVDTLTFEQNKSASTYNRLSPRGAVKFSLGKNNSIKVAYNRLFQFIHLISNTTAPTPVDIWQVSNQYIEPLQSDNYSIGFFQNFDQNKWELSFEVFYKSLQNVVEYKDFAELIVNPTLESQLLNAEGKSKGFEVFINRSTKRWKGWVSYTWSQTQLRTTNAAINGGLQLNEGNWFNSNYDQTHNFRFVSDLKMGNKGSFGTAMVFNSGRPITGLDGYYNIGEVNVPNFSDRNNIRIPNYWRLDISFTIGSILRKAEDKLVLSMYNILGRENAYSVFYKRPDNINQQRPFKLTVLGSAFPSITYSFTIK